MTNTPDNSVTYRSLSKFYDLFDLIFLLGGRGNPRSGLLEVIGDARLRVLDMCVGTAASAILVAAQRPQSQVVGVDISADMLSVAQRKITQSKLANLEVINMPADATQFADDSFDVVMVSFALHEFEPGLRDRVFKEARRVLKPGGKFCVIDFARQDSRRNRIFIKIWSLIEPPCFTAFLNLDWRRQLTVLGLHYQGEKEYSFSKLYVLKKE